MPDKKRPEFDDNDLPWQSSSNKPSSETPNTNTPDNEELPPWMQSSDDPASSGSADLGMPDFADWQIPDAPTSSSGVPSKPGLTGMLPWRQETSDPADASASVPGGTDLSWLDSVSTPPPSQPPAPSQPPPAPIKSLKQPAPQSTQQPTEAPVQRPGLRKLSAQPAQPAQQKQPPEDLAGLTYEEWERRQIAQEQAATRDPNEALLDEVPDWFGTAAPTNTPVEPNADPAQKAAEFVPDWFAGMEEQSANSAPDWFNTADMSNVAASALAGPETINNTPTAQPPSTSNTPANDVPDWMRTGDVAGMDFEAMFGTPASETANAVPSGADADTLDWMSDFGGALPPPVDATSQPSKQPSAMPVSQLPSAPIPSAEDDLASLDWLSGSTDLDSLPSMQSPDQQPSDQQSPAGLPDWMAEIGTSDAEVSQSAAPSASDAAIAQSDNDIPEWMRDMAPAAPTPMAAANPVQDWFADSSADEPNASQASEAQAQSETLTPGALPDWLSGIQPGTPSPPRAPKPANVDLDLSKSFSSDDLDALLNLPAASTISVSEPDLSQSESASMDDFDLDKVLGPATPEETEPFAEAPTNQPPGVRPPGGVRKLPTIPTRPGGTQGSGEGLEADASAISAGQVPGYIQDLRSGPKELNIGTVRIDVDEAPVAQLPDQLRQLRERSVQFTPPDQPRAMTTGPLAELQGTLTAEPILVKAASLPGIATNTVIGDLQGRRVKLIQDMLEIEDAEPQTGAALAVKPQTRTRIKVDRLVITLVLLLVLIAPFFTDGLNLVALPDISKPTAEQFAVFNAMDSLQAGQPVLVAFEYGPTGAGELDDMARVLLTDLFKRGAKPVIVSTNPSGALHAESLLEVFGHNTNVLTMLNRVGKPLLARTDYVVLRYLPAGAAGVRSVFSAIYQGGFQAESEFLTDVEGQSSGLSLDKDVPALGTVPAVVIAETPDDVRNWAEQYRVVADAGSAPVAHLILAAAAAADATARTYSASQPGTILGPLIGLRDATVYRALRQPPTKASDAKVLDQRWQSTGIGALLAGLIIFLGSMFSLIQAVRRRGARR